MSGRYSNQSGSRYNHSRQPRNDVPPSYQESLNGSYTKSNLPPNRQERPLATSQTSAPPIQQNSLVNYFSESHHEPDEIVDVDEAINGDSMQNPDASYLDK